MFGKLSPLGGQPYTPTKSVDRSITSDLPTTPLRITKTTTACKMRGALTSNQLPDWHKTLAFDRIVNRRAGNLKTTYENNDLRDLNIDQLEWLVIVAAKNGISIKGSGISGAIADDLIRRIESHCNEFPNEAPSLRAAVESLCIITALRDVRLSVVAPPHPSPAPHNELFPPPYKTTFVTSGTAFSTSVRLYNATRLFVLTKVPVPGGERIVTSTPISDNGIDNFREEWLPEHQPNRSNLDHEFIVVTPGVQMQNRQWRILNPDIDAGLAMGNLTAPAPFEPATSHQAGPPLFEHVKTWLFVYPADPRNILGNAIFTLHVPKNENAPVELFLLPITGMPRYTTQPKPPKPVAK
jgi:hypothetical protein